MRLYSTKDSRIAGKLVDTNSTKVQFKPVLNKQQKMFLGLVGILLAIINVAFLAWLINPTHIVPGKSIFLEALILITFCFIVIIELVRIIQAATLWLFASKAIDPVPYKPQKGLKVAILTTIVPSKEPIEIVRKTLAAMKKIEYDGKVDVWILDEGNDPRVKRMAKELGVKHFSRFGKPEFNQPSGEFKTKSKAGNHNSWRAKHEREYDVIAQMDPDHIPRRNFLERTLGYFRDQNIAFVVAPQVYGNQSHRWLTRASASQAYIFHGIIQRGGNGFGSPLLIGTNHLYRPKAWKQIGGYQDSIIEDHLTSMKLHGTINPETGKPWQSIYTPDIISVGEGPTSWTDYFNQQKRWAYGIWEIALKHALPLHKNLKLGQKLSYAALQFFYPSVAVVWLMGNVVSALYFTLGIRSMNVSASTWFYFWSLSLLTQIWLFTWLNRFNLTEHERKHGGIDAMLLTLLTSPVYVAAGLAALMHRPLVYAVTAKGNLRSNDTYNTYKSHLNWILVALVLAEVGFLSNRIASTQTIWDAFIAVVTGVPIAIFTWKEKLASGIDAITAFMKRPIFIRKSLREQFAQN